MSIHEYWCQGCGERLEKLVRNIHREAPVVSCPKCGARMTKKIGKVAHFEFKGALV